MNQELGNGEVPRILYGASGNGWITQQFFKEWFHRHFLAFLPNIRPVLFLIDGHSTHYFPETIQMQSCPLYITTPHNSLKLTQPLHKGCFAPLKMAWCEVCQCFILLASYSK